MIDDSHAVVAAVPTLEGVVRLEQLTHMVVTHLSPKRIASLKEVLAQRAKRRPASRLELILSNPALQLLRTMLGMPHCLTGTRPAERQYRSSRCKAERQTVRGLTLCNGLCDFVAICCERDFRPYILAYFRVKPRHHLEP